MKLGQNEKKEVFKRCLNCAVTLGFLKSTAEKKSDKVIYVGSSFGIGIRDGRNNKVWLSQCKLGQI